MYIVHLSYAIVSAKVLDLPYKGWGFKNKSLPTW